MKLNFFTAKLCILRQIASSLAQALLENLVVLGTSHEVINGTVLKHHILGGALTYFFLFGSFWSLLRMTTPLDEDIFGKASNHWLDPTTILFPWKVNPQSQKCHIFMLPEPGSVRKATQKRVLLVRTLMGGIHLLLQSTDVVWTILLASMLNHEDRMKQVASFSLKPNGKAKGQRYEGFKVFQIATSRVVVVVNLSQMHSVLVFSFFV